MVLWRLAFAADDLSQIFYKMSALMLRVWCRIGSLSNAKFPKEGKDTFWAPLLALLESPGLGRWKVSVGVRCIISPQWLFELPSKRIKILL